MIHWVSRQTHWVSLPILGILRLHRQLRGFEGRRHDCLPGVNMTGFEIPMKNEGSNGKIMGKYRENHNEFRFRAGKIIEPNGDFSG